MVHLARILTLVVCLGSVTGTLTASTAEQCTLFFEDFAITSPHSWSGKNATWYVQGATVWAEEITPGRLAYLQTDFVPTEFFTFDVDLNWAASGEGTQIGLYPYTTGDMYFGFSEWTVDGIGIIVTPDGKASALWHDVLESTWYASNAVNVPVPITSIGLTYRESAIGLRVNGNEIGAVPGSFALFAATINRLWLIAMGDETKIGFDNLCARPLATADAPPSVSISSPPNGYSVNGSITIQAAATDDIGVARVEFHVDSVKQGEDSSSPYSWTWNTTAVSNGQHTIKAVAVDTIGQSATSQVTVNVQNPVTLTINRSGTGQGTVTSSPVGINCGGDCSQAYSPGTIVVLSAQAEYGSEFSGWSGACAGSGNCSITVNADTWVTARFDLNEPPSSGSLIQYSYDDAGQLLLVEYPDDTSQQYSYDPSGNLVARTAEVSVSKLFFPFYRSAPGTFLGIAVSNFSTSPADLRFEALGSSGETLPFPLNPSDFTLSPGNQLAKLGSQIFGTVGGTQSAWVELRSDNPELGSFFQFGNSTLTQLDGSTAFDRVSRELYFSRIYQGNAAFRGQQVHTYLSLANPTEESVEARLRLYNLGVTAQGVGDISPTAETTVTIPARGFVYRSAGELFSRSLIEGGYVQVQVLQEGGLVGFELIELPGHKTLIGLSASPGNVNYELYSAQLADASVIYTNLKFVNVSDQSRQIRITAVGGSGSNLKAPKTVSLGPRGQVELDAGEFFGFPTTSSLTVGSIKIETDGPGVIGDVLFGDPIGFKYAASMPLQDKKFRKAVFSQVANVVNFFTGLALYNPNPDGASVSIEVFSAKGESRGKNVIQVEAGSRLSSLVPELVPSTAGQAGGYIVIDSDIPIIAQQIFGEAHLNQFSAVPPKVVK